MDVETFLSDIDGDGVEGAVHIRNGICIISLKEKKKGETGRFYMRVIFTTIR